MGNGTVTFNCNTMPARSAQVSGLLLVQLLRLAAAATVCGLTYVITEG